MSKFKHLLLVLSLSFWTYLLFLQRCHSFVFIHLYVNYLSFSISFPWFLFLYSHIGISSSDRLAKLQMHNKADVCLYNHQRVNPISKNQLILSRQVIEETWSIDTWLYHAKIWNENPFFAKVYNKVWSLIFLHRLSLFQQDEKNLQTNSLVFINLL
jgi:hypothetical protein